MRALTDVEAKIYSWLLHQFLTGTQSQLSLSSTPIPLGLPLASRQGDSWAICCTTEIVLFYCELLHSLPMGRLKLTFLQTPERGLSRGCASAASSTPKQNSHLQLHKGILSSTLFTISKHLLDHRPSSPQSTNAFSRFHSHSLLLPTFLTGLRLVIEKKDIEPTQGSLHSTTFITTFDRLQTILIACLTQQLTVVPTNA